MTDSTDLHFLGCGAAFNPLKKNTGAFFELGDTLCLADCGETAFSQVIAKKLLDGKKSVLVFLTHLHADHVGSLASLLSYAAYALKIPAFVVYPSAIIIQLLDIMGVRRECYEYSQDVPQMLKIQLKLTPVAVTHVANMQCFGYIIETPDWQVYYSGDSIGIDASIIEKLKNGTIQKIYQDTCSKTVAQPTHCSLQELERLIPSELRSKVYCMHFDTDFGSEIRNAGFNQVNC